MNKRIIFPKFIKRAHQWMVHIITIGLDKSETQKMNWFSNEEDAQNFYKEELNAKNNTN